MGDNINDENSKVNSGLSEIALTDDEKKEKLFLEFAYFNHKIESKITDKKELKELKNIYSSLESSLKDVLKYEVSKKNIASYIHLKESDFDPEIIRLAKFLK